ncbi:MAG: glycosyltransferase, partial [Candidatus Dadabacteria bacterium]|nr:glycosyltransferase [Candidatus Dadabacteria bacterium]
MEKTVVIIPALNEERSIGKVIGDIPRDLVTEIVVVDNGSTDSTARVASGSGATVIDEERKGYGWACLAGIKYIKNSSYLPD